MISVNQDCKLKRTVKKPAISLIYRFVFCISSEYFPGKLLVSARETLAFSCDLSGILEEGIL